MWEVELLDYGIQHDFYSELSNKQLELNMWEVKFLDSNFQKMITLGDCKRNF